jgi:hypothetical protein
LSDAPTRPHCPGCREPMKFVKAIPQLGALPELFVFHCTRCNQAETIMQDRSA